MREKTRRKGDRVRRNETYLVKWKAWVAGYSEVII